MRWFVLLVARREPSPPSRNSSACPAGLTRPAGSTANGSDVELSRGYSKFGLEI